MMKLFRRTARRKATIPVPPEFGVRLTLCRGDKVVRRDAQGRIEVVLVMEERVDVRQVEAVRPEG